MRGTHYDTTASANQNSQQRSTTSPGSLLYNFKLLLLIRVPNESFHLSLSHEKCTIFFRRFSGREFGARIVPSGHAGGCLGQLHVHHLRVGNAFISVSSHLIVIVLHFIYLKSFTALFVYLSQSFKIKFVHLRRVLPVRAFKMTSSAKTKSRGKKAFTSILKVQKVRRYSTSSSGSISTLPRTTRERLDSSSSNTILYLAYGSNLSAETFKGTRGIKPISSVNVQVPTLSLTFDLSGIPYLEPCFANTKIRDPDNDPPKKNDYHKDRWHKGLIGVVYEVTPEDYRTIIATEGGGASYQDIIVPCYSLPAGGKTVDPEPKGSPFEAHTLFQPREEPDDDENSSATLQSQPVRQTSPSVQRPDPSYAQPSARYLKLLTDGAEEHSLPSEYIAYLYNIRPYTITTKRQRLGQVIFLATWFPLIIAIMGLGRAFADDKGRIPNWLVTVMAVVFKILWTTYDAFYKPVFGDGERTISDKHSLDEEIGCLWRDEKI